MFFLVTIMSKMLLRFFDNLFSDLVSTLFTSWGWVPTQLCAASLLTRKKVLAFQQTPKLVGARSFRHK